jgi:monoterpene epsilon-lactone hydrolase
MRALTLLISTVGCTALALAGQAAAQAASAAAPAAPMRAYVPSTISPEAAAIFARGRPGLLAPRPKLPTTPAGFEAVNKALLPMAEAHDAAIAKSLDLVVTDRQMAGVHVLEILPKDYHDDGSVLIHVHGGGFVLGSARSSLATSGYMATDTGRRVISVDYTVAPKGQWPLVTDQVIGVYKAVLASGVPASRIGMFGESAGASIIAAAALKLRDEGLPLPAGLLLLSPATDLSGAGDTRVTLAEADPILFPEGIQPGIDAYAPPADQKNPYVSPVYGDFTKGYPPTLIQGGTKELLLSDMVRLNRAIKQAGGNSDLELYEGMPHGFLTLMINAPEGKAAMAEAVAFWNQHLAAAKR